MKSLPIDHPAIHGIVQGVMEPKTLGVATDARDRSLKAIVDCIALDCECEGSCHAECQMADLRNMADYVAAGSPLLASPLHGYHHWLSVYRNAVVIAEFAGLHRFDASDGETLEFDFTACALLFSLFHDCRRVSDGRDLSHGAYGALALHSFHATGGMNPLTAEWAVAALACNIHTVVDRPKEDRALIDLLDDGMLQHEGDGAQTIRDAVGLCLDADRIDLLRLGMVPDPRFLTHQEAAERAAQHLWGNGAFNA
jgi:uncharacterized protein